MSHLAALPPVVNLAARLGLWGAATYGILRLGDLSIGPEHSVCGPWGCGPTIPALAAAHGFWLMVFLPGAIWAIRTIPAVRLASIGRTLVWLGLGGLAALVIADLANWLATARPELRPYAVRRAFFAVATLVEVPLAPMALAGLILLRSGPRSKEVAPGPPHDCVDGSCERPSVVDSRRLEIGSRMPTLGALLPEPGRGRPLVLYFMRSAGCSICLGHVRELRRLSEEIRSMGAEVLVVHPGTAAASRNLTEALDLPFAVASGANFYERVGLGSRMAIRGSGTLVVDTEGVVRHARRAVLPFSAFDRAELLEALRANALAGAGPGA